MGSHMIGTRRKLNSVRCRWDGLAAKEMDELAMQKDEPWNDGDGTNLELWNGNEMGWNGMNGSL